MGMYLINEKFYDFDWSMTGWSMVLDLAVLHGWKPAGTRSRKGTCRWDKNGNVVWSGILPGWEKRRGEYDSNDAQVVTRQDSRALARALKRSLAHIKVVPAARSRLSVADVVVPDPPSRKTRKTRKRAPEPEEESDPHRFFASPHDLRHLKAFIAFCRMGAFQIR